MHELKKVVQNLEEDEAKRVLFLLLLRISMLEETNCSEEEFTKDLQQMYKDILSLTMNQNTTSGEYTTAHIVMGDSPSNSLRMTLRKMGLEDTERVFALSDMFSIGPIWNLHEDHGQEHRYEWLANHLLYDDQDEIDQYKSKLRSTLSEINAIPQHVPIIIWTGDNSHEQTGVRFVLHLIKEKSNDIRLINSALAYKTQCSQPNIDYVPRSTGELPPEKLSLLYEKNRESQPLSREERKHFEEEWEELSSTKQEVLRIWGNGTITNVPANYYDGYILHTARKLHKSQEKRDYMKSARLIGEVIGHLNQYLDDQYIEYRVRHLIMNGSYSPRQESLGHHSSTAHPSWHQIHLFQP